METFRCVYCKRELPVEKASDSDIIPFAFMAGKKLLLKNKVCKECNNYVNEIAEQTLISSFESLRRRINATKRRGGDISNKYIIRYQKGNTHFETNAIKSDDPYSLLEKPLHFKNKANKGVLLGPYDKVREIASKKGHENKVEQIDVEDGTISIAETYSISNNLFFSKQMKTMVAKVCYEWLISICPELNPFSDEYDNIRNSICNNTVEEDGLVDIVTNIDIAKALFEDMSPLKEKENTSFIPKKLIVGNYYLFFEIKNGKLYCFIAFMGIVLYRVLITTDSLPEIGESIWVSKIYMYRSRTGESELWEPNRDIWSELSFHLSNQANYNNTEEYKEYLTEKIQELIQFQIVE